MLKFSRISALLKNILKWVVIGLASGAVGGLIGGMFVHGVVAANRIWHENTWITFMLPIAGIGIVFAYRKLDFTNPKGTNRIIDKIRAKEELPVKVAPLIFFSTLVTHLFGGSAGREGAAVQIGGSIGSGIAKVFRLDDKDTSMAVICGVSSVFAALFSTPVTAVFFALEVVSVGVIYYSGLIPCITASYTAICITKFMHIPEEKWSMVDIPQLNMEMVCKTALIGVFAAVASIVIIIAFSMVKTLAEANILNPYVRVVVGGLIISAFTVFFYSGRYNGSGTEVIMEASKGDSFWWDAPVKLIFTAITLGFGFKGGEIVPTLFIGATTGCTIGYLIGLDPGFAAAAGMIGTFCGAVNCPVASIFLSIELFGSDGIIFFTLVCAISYTFSGYFSLYSSQRIVYSKTRAELINISAKSYSKKDIL